MLNMKLNLICLKSVLYREIEMNSQCLFGNKVWKFTVQAASAGFYDSSLRSYTELHFAYYCIWGLLMNLISWGLALGMTVATLCLKPCQEPQVSG